MRSPYTLDDPPPLQPPGPVIEITAWSIAADLWHEHHPDTLLGADCMRCRCAWPCATWEVADGIIAGVYAEHLQAARTGQAPARAGAGRTLALPAAAARSAPTGPPPRVARSGRPPLGAPPLRPAAVAVDDPAPAATSVDAVDEPTLATPTLATVTRTDLTVASPVLTTPQNVVAAVGVVAPRAGVPVQARGPAAVAEDAPVAGGAPVASADGTGRRIVVARRIREALFHPRDDTPAAPPEPAPRIQLDLPVGATLALPGDPSRVGR